MKTIIVNCNKQQASCTNGFLLKTQIKDKYLKLGSFSGEFFTIESLYLKFYQAE